METMNTAQQQKNNVINNMSLNQENFNNRHKLLKQKGQPDIFSKAYQFIQVEIAKQSNCYPYYKTIDQNEGPVAIIDGKECVMLGSNNYLGLTIHPEVRKAAVEAIEKYGTSLTGSRLLNGTHILHEQLENKLAEFLGKEDALVFTTGYQANLGLISALVGKYDTLIMDKMNHASIYDGSKLAKGNCITFEHNDMMDLEIKLNGLPENTGKLIIIDGLFSMEGDICPLPEIVRLAKKYNARVAVDDAHAVGILGECGKGTSHHYGLEKEIDLVVGTFSKTLASVGGFVAGEKKVVELIKHFGRSVVFSASLPPASAAAALKALEIMQREPDRVERVNMNADYMRERLVNLGYDVGVSETPVIPIMIGNEITTLQMWKELLNEGVYVNCVLHPAVPRDESLLRTSYTSEHTRDHLDKALKVFERLKKKYRI